MYLIKAPTGELAVAETAEIIRVRNLPTRDWSTDPNAPRMIELLTNWLQHTPAKCAPRCTCCKYVSELNDAQAAFLSEFFALGRSVVPLRTGKGKTLAALLAGTVLAKALGRTPKVLMIIPASGKQKTITEACDYAKHWRCAAFKLVTYEFLSNPKNLEWLIEFDADLVLADEAHKLTATSKAWRRLAAFLAWRIEKKGVPATFVPFTASMTARKLRECWHYTRAAMGNASPFPATRDEMQVWAAATDEKVPIESQVLPGAMCTLAPRPEGDHGLRERAQLQLGARIASTPGFVSTKEDIPPVTLKLGCTELALPAHVQEMVAVLRKKKELPNGRQFSQAWDVWKHARRFGCGLYQDWDPPAPRAWLEARRAWYDFVNTYLERRKDIDSHVHVVNRIDRGELDDGGVLAHWREIEPHFTPNSVAHWVDDTTLKYCADWLSRKENAKGICWVEFSAFGEKLQDMTGLPYFAKDASCRRSGAKLAGYEGTPMIVSVKHGQLFNLQAYDRNLLSTVLPMGAQLDQLIGRTCRNGQESEEVHVEFLMTVLESYTALDQCFRDAKRAQRVDGQAQKLCYGECIDPVIQGLRG